MNWFLDIVVIFFVLAMAIYGIKVGFFGSTINLVLVIACIGGAGFLAYITALKGYESWGWIADFGNFWLKILGDSKIPGGQEIIEKVAYYLSFGILTFITFVIYSVILHTFRRILLKAFNKLKKGKLIKFLDNFLGLVVNLALSLGVVMFFMAFVHSFNGQMFVHTNEAFLGSEVLSLLYNVNPLNALVDKLGLADMLINSLGSFLG